MSAQSLLERLAAAVLRKAVTGGLSDDPLLIVASSAPEALRQAADGEISATTALDELNALADHDKLGTDLARIREESLRRLRGGQ